MAEIRKAHSYERRGFYLRPDPATVDTRRIISDAVERIARDPKGLVRVIVGDNTEWRVMARFDETTHRRVPVTAAGERVEYHIDGTTHVVQA